MKNPGMALCLQKYACQKYGITTGEPLASARRKCPGLIVVKPDFAVYVEQSNRLRALLRRYTDAVIPYSIDEAWAEFENFGRMYGEPEAFANKLRCEIKETLGFTVNIGISTNRLLAKMAGDFKKPDLVHTLFPEEVPGNCGTFQWSIFCLPENRPVNG